MSFTHTSKTAEPSIYEAYWGTET